MYLVNVDKPTQITVHRVDSPYKRCWQRTKKPKNGYWAKVDPPADVWLGSEDKYLHRCRLCKPVW